MKKALKILKANRRIISIFLIFAMFVSVYSNVLITSAQELSDAYKHWKNEASYTNAFDYALFSGSETDSFVTNAKKRTKEIEDGEITWRYQDSRGNTVITDEYGEKIVTVYSYPRWKNHKNYIPKGGN